MLKSMSTSQHKAPLSCTRPLLHSFTVFRRFKLPLPLGRRGFKHRVPHSPPPLLSPAHCCALLPAFSMHKMAQGISLEEMAAPARPRNGYSFAMSCVSFPVSVCDSDCHLRGGGFFTCEQSGSVIQVSFLNAVDGDRGLRLVNRERRRHSPFVQLLLASPPEAAGASAKPFLCLSVFCGADGRFSF